MESRKEDSDTKKIFNFGEVFKYFFRKKRINKNPNINLRLMHGINKISIIIFIVAVLIIVGRIIFR